MREQEEAKDSEEVVFVDRDADDEGDDELSEEPTDHVQQLLDSGQAAGFTRRGRLCKMPESFKRLAIRHPQSKNTTRPEVATGTASQVDCTFATQGRKTVGNAAPQGKRPNLTNLLTEAGSSTASAKRGGRAVSGARKKSNNKGKEKAGPSEFIYAFLMYLGEVEY